MNSRLFLYVSGAPYLVRFCNCGGRRVPVLDRTKRWRAAARAMRAAGRTELEIVMALRRSRASINKVLDFSFRI